MNAILWDGQKQLHGYLDFGSDGLIFRLRDFSDTNLHLVIPYESIRHVALHKLYGITTEAVEILTQDGRKNVFVSEDVEKIKSEINERINLSRPGERGPW